jgi:adenosylcobinamide-GDP ribazoletransferase
VSALASTLRAAAAAVGFLTRIPVGRLRIEAEDVGRGTLFFPLVGAGVGALVGSVAESLDGVLGAFLAAGVAVACEAALTGAIHLDALADFADGLGAGSRERALEVMRDPSTGAFGALALGLDLLLKVGAVSLLVAEGNAVLALLAAVAIGRGAPLALASLPYARPGQGSGRALTDAPAWPRAGGLVVAGAIAAVALGWDALPIAGGAAAGVFVVGSIAQRRLGGVTGDVLGAGAELATLGALLAAVAAQ